MAVKLRLKGRLQKMYHFWPPLCLHLTRPVTLADICRYLHKGRGETLACLGYLLLPYLTLPYLRGGQVLAAQR